MKLNPERFHVEWMHHADYAVVSHPDRPDRKWCVPASFLYDCDDDFIAAVREVQRRERDRRGGPLPNKRFPAQALRRGWKPAL